MLVVLVVRLVVGLIVGLIVGLVVGLVVRLVVPVVPVGPLVAPLSPTSPVLPAVGAVGEGAVAVVAATAAAVVAARLASAPAGVRLLRLLASASAAIVLLLLALLRLLVLFCLLAFVLLFRIFPLWLFVLNHGMHHLCAHVPLDRREARRAVFLRPCPNSQQVGRGLEHGCLQRLQDLARLELPDDLRILEVHRIVEHRALRTFVPRRPLFESARHREPTFARAADATSLHTPGALRRLLLGTLDELEDLANLERAPSFAA
mmetsp:Transcript_3233/g.8030  ORF Transcript_3233/g.8030 Transcript_3233/m.8030 type:complete len:261 (-) Transcript_3233:218-1000(-)